MTRTLYAIGAGPGDPELMTLRGTRILQAVTHVYLPATRESASYVRSIVDEYLNPARQTIVELVCPTYRSRAKIEQRWRELAEVVDKSMPDGGQGAFACEGDPSLYSTFLHLRNGLEAIHSQIDLRVVPGVSAVSACAAAAGFSLAVWDERLLIAPAVRDEADLRMLLAQADSVCLLKAGGSLQSLAAALQSLSDETQFAAVRRAGRPEEAVVTDASKLQGLSADYFTTVLVRRSEQ